MGYNLVRGKTKTLRNIQRDDESKSEQKEEVKAPSPARKNVEVAADDDEESFSDGALF